MCDNCRVDFRWLKTDGFTFPKDGKFACTGFREDEGINEIFSVIVHLKNYEEINKAREANIEALADPMSFKLPKCGERFFLTSGPSIFAECIGIS
jgi:hypothetical protein